MPPFQGSKLNVIEFLGLRLRSDLGYDMPAFQALNSQAFDFAEVSLRSQRSP